MKVVVIGAGYVGINCGAAFAYLGHRVSVIEKNPAKLALLHAGQSPIHEHGLQDLLNLASVKANMSFSDGVDGLIARAELAMIAVGTPPGKHGQANTEYVEEAAAEIGRAVAEGQRLTVVVKSTVPVGTNRRVRAVIEREIAERGIKCEVRCVSNPEFLREGRALPDMLYPDRIVIGTECESAIDAMHRLYRPILEQSFEPPVGLDRPQGYTLPRFTVTSPTSAELVKYASNAFLATKISFINEIAGLCDRLGADVIEVARGMGLDSRIGQGFLQAGLGWGGSCFPKDTQALLAMGCDHDYVMPIIQAAVEVNQRQRQVMIDKLQGALKGLRGRTITLFGLAFKPGTDDVRSSPAIDLIEMIVARGAYVRVHDPIALESFQRDFPDLEAEVCACPIEAARGADAIAMVTEWPEYQEVDWQKIAGVMASPVVVDGRNFLKRAPLCEAGMELIQIGR